MLPTPVGLTVLAAAESSHECWQYLTEGAMGQIRQASPVRQAGEFRWRQCSGVYCVGFLTYGNAFEEVMVIWKTKRTTSSQHQVEVEEAS